MMFCVVVCRYNTSGVNGSTIDCFYSRTNSSLAITDLDPATNTRDLLLAFLSPILICTVSGLVILLLHRGDPSQTERRYVGHIVVVEDQRQGLPRIKAMKDCTDYQTSHTIPSKYIVSSLG